MRNHFTSTTTALTIITTITLVIALSTAHTANSQGTDASVEIRSGAITITPPEEIIFNKLFIPNQYSGPYFTHKTLRPNNTNNQLTISDYDGAGINYKVSVSMTNLYNIDIPHSVIPFTNFGLVTLALDTQTGIDIVTGTPDLNGLITPSACPWDGQSGKLEDNCNNYLFARTFIGDGTTISTDPTTTLDTTSTVVPVQDSTHYSQGDVISFIDIEEKALIIDIISPTEIEVVRGIADTTFLPHQATSGIKNLGQQSLEQDIFIAPENVSRLATYSMGFGLRALLEPSLELHPGNYSGTITFTLYTCPTTTCL